MCFKEISVQYCLSIDRVTQFPKYLSYISNSNKKLFLFWSSIDLFLISMGYNNVVCLFQMFIIPIHLFTSWLLVTKLQYGIPGAAIANKLTAILTFLGQIVYVS